MLIQLRTPSQLSHHQNVMPTIPRRRSKPWNPYSSTSCHVGMIQYIVVLAVLSSLLSLSPQCRAALEFLPTVSAQVYDGPTSVAKGRDLFQSGAYEEAAMEFWKAVLLHSQTPPERQYNVQEVFQSFMQCYIVQGRMADGFAFVASESFQRGQISMGENYLQQALAVDPHNAAAKAVQMEYRQYTGASMQQSESVVKDSDQYNDDLKGKTPEELYDVASSHFSKKNFEQCADVFEIGCLRSNNQLGPACANAVYCRTMIADYGFNGSQFDKDMIRIAELTKKEAMLYRLAEGIKPGQPFGWRRATSVHPHMMLGYPVDPLLKRYVAESVAFMDEAMARAAQAVDGKLPPLPEGLPYDVDEYRMRFQNERQSNANVRIRIGFVGSGFNSKAVLYLSHDMFRFFDKTDFEVHVFSFGPPDGIYFIQNAMKGADWRERVRANVDRFHDCQAMKLDHIKAAQYIHEHGIHVLIEWDGYARQGERAQGLFALRPAPIQILHQEYLGTSGSLHTDYLFTDLVTSPLETQSLYTEKLIYMPNHFFSKGHAYQKEVKQPTLDYAAASFPYKPGTGTPQENRCLSPPNVGPQTPSFVYCNFNKLLKANPETFRSWIRILREVPDSILCLLDNPDTAIPYVRRFVHEAAGASNGNSDPETFVPGDGDELNDRIHFLPWENSPFEHQKRNQDFCNVMLDSYPYNGHTVAQDALYGGVPIVTRSDGQDMSSRVTTSANIVLGLDKELNANGGPSHYENIAIALGNNQTKYKEIRKILIGTALQRNPMHPYWDVARYVKNFESGLRSAWEIFLRGDPPRHIFVEEREEARKGTYDSEILAHPPEGRRIPDYSTQEL